MVTSRLYLKYRIRDRGVAKVDALVLKVRSAVSSGYPALPQGFDCLKNSVSVLQ